MNYNSITHVQSAEFIYPLDRHKVLVRLHCLKDDLQRVTLIYWHRQEPSCKFEDTMKIKNRTEFTDYFEGMITTSENTHYIKYIFLLEDYNGTKMYLYQNGFSEALSDNGSFEYLYTNDVNNSTSWALDLIYYQIFPERFCKADGACHRRNLKEWGDKPDRENYFGGNIEGIMQKINYIKELSIDCIYFSPLFKGDFNHKYATADYFTIDNDFGTNEDFRRLVHMFHENNIKVLVDGVFNHCGVNFRQFRDVLEKQEKSRYTDWFYIKKYPVTVSEQCYECVGDYKFMPKLRTSNPEVCEFIYSVMEYWINFADIDGFRLDVSDEVDMTVWRYIRYKLDFYHPEILLLGETWGSGLDLIKKGRLDSVMNYIFRDIAVDFFAKRTIDAKETDNRLQNMLALYGTEKALFLYNLLDSHDTERFFTLCRENIDIYKAAVAFQIMFLGCPAIFYGDEVGITGENDPDCRKCMVWGEKQNKGLLAWFKKIIKIRKTHPCVQTGDYYAVLCDGNTFGFCRKNGEDTIYILINNSGNARKVKLPVIACGEYKDLVTGCSIRTTKAAGTDTFLNSDLLEYSGLLCADLSEYSVNIFCKI